MGLKEKRLPQRRATRLSIATAEDDAVIEGGAVTAAPPLKFHRGG